MIQTNVAPDPSKPAASRKIEVYFFGDDTTERVTNFEKNLRIYRCREYPRFKEEGYAHAWSAMFRVAMQKAEDHEVRLRDQSRCAEGGPLIPVLNGPTIPSHEIQKLARCVCSRCDVFNRIRGEEDADGVALNRPYFGGRKEGRTTQTLADGVFSGHGWRACSFLQSCYADVCATVTDVTTVQARRLGPGKGSWRVLEFATSSEDESWNACLVRCLPSARLLPRNVGKGSVDVCVGVGVGANIAACSDGPAVNCSATCDCFTEGDDPLLSFRLYSSFTPPPYANCSES